MPDTHEFFTRKHEKLNRLEASVVKTQTELDAARSEAMENLQAKRAGAKASRDAFQQKIAEPDNKMKASIEDRRSETEATIEEWKRKREVNKLENRAENLEDYADAAMTVLDIAQEEAPSGVPRSHRSSRRGGRGQVSRYHRLKLRTGWQPASAGYHPNRREGREQMDDTRLLRAVRDELAADAKLDHREVAASIEPEG